MARIVTFTPLGIESDSRTFKQASSLARLGHDSVVMEGWPSTRLPRDGLPFELRTPSRFISPHTGQLESSQAEPVEPPSAGIDVSSENAVRSSPSPIGRAARRLPSGVLAPMITMLNVSQALRAQHEAYVRRPTAEAPPADLYYLHSYQHFPAAAVLARRHGARIVYDAHDFYAVLGEDGRRAIAAERAVLRVHRLIEAACVRRADAIVTVSDGVADLIQQRYGRRPLVIRNCHDRRLDRPIARTVRTVTGVGPDAMLLVMVGNAKPGGQAIHEALRTLQLLPNDTHLALVGRGYDAFAYADEAAALGVGD